MTRSKIGWLFLGLAFAFALASTTPDIYAQGNDPTLIHACVEKSNGNVRIVDAATSCKHNEIIVYGSGTTAIFGQGSIIIRSAGIGGGSPNPSVCLFIGSTCAYRSPRDGTIQNMRLLIESNGYRGPAVLTIFLNGNPTLLSTSIPAGSTSDIDVPGIVDVFDGDRISVLLDTSAVPVTSGSILLSVSYEIK